MPYCPVCKIETDWEYDIALSNGDYLHYSCIILLQQKLVVATNRDSNIFTPFSKD